MVPPNEDEMESGCQGASRICTFCCRFSIETTAKEVLVRLRHVKSAKRLDEVQAKESSKRFKEAEQS